MWTTGADGNRFGRGRQRSAPIAWIGGDRQGFVAEGRETVNRPSGSQGSGVIEGLWADHDGIRIAGRPAGGQGEVGTRFAHCTAVCDMGHGSDQWDGPPPARVEGQPIAMRSNPRRASSQALGDARLIGQSVDGERVIEGLPG